MTEDDLFKHISDLGLAAAFTEHGWLVIKNTEFERLQETRLEAVARAAKMIEGTCPDWPLRVRAIAPTDDSIDEAEIQIEKAIQQVQLMPRRRKTLSAIVALEETLKYTLAAIKRLG